MDLLKELGPTPSDRDIFTNFVMDSAIILIHSFSKVVVRYTGHQT